MAGISGPSGNVAKMMRSLRRCRAIGHVRWTICAMLFAATSINYMDRQVLALLKPTLMQSVANQASA